MGLLDKLRGRAGRTRRADVVVLGLDNAGKTSLLNALRPEERRVTHIEPTLAPREDVFHGGGVSFSARDVPGAGRHRALWERHVANADAVLFVVDAADALRLVVAREELSLILSRPELSGVPLLILANKSDAPGALPPCRVAAALGLPEGGGARAWHVAAVSARSGAGLGPAVAWLATALRDAPR